VISKKSIGLVAAFFCFFVYFDAAGKLFAQGQELTAAEIITNHIKSLGDPAVLEKVKNRGMVGKAAMEFKQGVTGSNSDGVFNFISEGKNLGMILSFPDNNYPGEYFAYNGKETSVADITPGMKSKLGEFLFKYNAIMKDGFLGGSMSVAWPLLHPEGQQGFTAKREKIKEFEFYVLEKRLGDIKVKLFFDAKSFRHQRTEYDVKIKEDITQNKQINLAQDPVQQTSSSPTPTRVGDLTPKATISDVQPETNYQLVEMFDSFSNVGNLVLPISYGIYFSYEGHNETIIGQWSALVHKWVNNGQKITPSFFVAKGLQPSVNAPKTPAAPSSK
jgi:hypothetical protein